MFEICRDEHHIGITVYRVGVSENETCIPLYENFYFSGKKALKEFNFIINKGIYDEKKCNVSLGSRNVWLW